VIAILTIQSLLECSVEFGVVEIAPDIAHLSEEVFPVGFVEFDRVGFLGSKGSDGLIQAVSKPFIRQILTVHSDQ